MNWWTPDRYRACLHAVVAVAAVVVGLAVADGNVEGFLVGGCAGLSFSQAVVYGSRS